MVVVSWRTRVDVQAVGHGDLVQGDGDNWWMAMLGIRPIYGHHILGRETHLAAVEWEDGWPVINPGPGRLDSPLEQPQSRPRTGCGSP